MMRALLWVLLLVASSAFAAPGDLIFTHTFENNSLDPASGTLAGQGDRVGPPVVSTVRANGGTHSALLNIGNTSLGYVLTTDYASVTVRWDMWIPSNYKAAKNFPTAEHNNKIFRIYSSVGYGSSEKVGFSTYNDTTGVDSTFEELVPEWGAPGGNGSAIGPQGTGSQNFLLSADQGTWVTYQAYYSPPKAAGTGNRGTLKFWKNGVLIINESGTVDNYDPADVHSVHEFYILGAANTGFTPDVDFYIDNISVWEGEPNAGGAGVVVGAFNSPTPSTSSAGKVALSASSAFTGPQSRILGVVTKQGTITPPIKYRQQWHRRRFGDTHYPRREKLAANE